MSLIIRPKRANLTPVYGLDARINWGHPLAKDIVTFVVLAGTQGVELVTNTILLPQNGATIVSTPSGPMLDCAAANRGMQATARGPVLSMTKGMSVLWAGTWNGSAPSATSRLAGLSYASSTASPFDVLNIQTDQFLTNYYPITVFNSGGSQLSIGQVTEVMNPSYNQAVGVVDLARQEIWVNRVKAGTITRNVSAPTYGTDPQWIFGTYPGQSFNSNISGQTLIMWARTLEANEITDLWDYGISELLIPSRKYVFAASSGGPVAVTGRLESASEIRAGLAVASSLTGRIESASEVRAATAVARALTARLESLTELRVVLDSAQYATARIESASEMMIDSSKFFLQLYGPITGEITDRTVRGRILVKRSPIAIVLTTSDRHAGPADAEDNFTSPADNIDGT